jgi:hypothetical protein
MPTADNRHRRYRVAAFTVDPIMSRVASLTFALSGLVMAGSAAAADGAVPTVDPERADAVASAAPRWSASGTPTERGYRLSLTRGSFDVGVHFDARPAAPHPFDGRFDSAAPPGATLPALTLGLSTVSTGPAPASSLIERAFGSGTGVPYERKVGIEWKPAQSQVFLNQGLGFRLGGDDKLTMRLRKGSLGIYMKRTF